jgi:hypothetical protein
MKRRKLDDVRSWLDRLCEADDDDDVISLRADFLSRMRRIPGRTPFFHSWDDSSLMHTSEAQKCDVSVSDGDSDDNDNDKEGSGRDWSLPHAILSKCSNEVGSGPEETEQMEVGLASNGAYHPTQLQFSTLKHMEHVRKSVGMQ